MEVGENSSLPELEHNWKPYNAAAGTLLLLCPTYLRVYLVFFQGSLEDFCRCYGLTSMFDRIWMEIVQWWRNLICFLWKCKSCTVTWKLLHFKNLSLNESKSDIFTGIPCRLSGQSWGFLPMFRFDLDVWSHLDGNCAVKATFCLFSLKMYVLYSELKAVTF